MRKKLQQLHNEAAQKRFTTFIALLVMLLFAIGGSLQVQAQDANTNGTPIAGIESLTGCNEDQVRAAAIIDNTFPEEDKTKIFFLYNVQTGLLLNAGGYWGTHVSLKEYGMPLWIHIDEDKDKDDKKGWIHLAHKFDSKESKEEGNYLEYETGNSPEEDNGVYIDRAYLYTKTILWVSTTTIVKRGWKLELVPDTDKPNTYKLYTYRNTSSKPYDSPRFDTTKKYYLIATKTQGDVDKNCGAVEEGSTEIADGNDEWRFLSYQQILDLQDKNSDNIISSIDLTFRLQCPSFSRENAAMSNWKAYQYRRSEEGKIRLGLEHYYKPYVNSDVTTAGYCTIKSYTNDFNNNFSYTFPDGSDAITFKGNKGNENYERHCGKYYCADAKNFRGTIYQDVKVSHGGTYVIECKGFSTTTKAKLYACLVKDDNTADTTTMHATILGQTNYMSVQEKKALHIEEQNMDYAAKEFYGSHKYFNSVLVQVPEPEGDVTRTIRFGIEIGTQGDTEPVEGEWTVFDDFRLLYTSKTTDGDLVLDQDRDNLNYLKDCSNTYKSVTLHLNKTFDKEQWNGFVLPVSLTKDQLTQAFGPNVKLAKLSKLTSNEIQFVSINMSTVGSDEIAMQAYIPYIIFPTKHAEQKQTPAYTALLSKIVNGQAKDERVIIGKNHIDIPNVSFAVNGENKNDLSNMDTYTWTTKSRIVVNGSGTPFVTGDGMTAFGTFARTFGEGTQNTTESDEDYGKWTIENKSKIIEGRSNLKGCYFFSNGKMYSSATRARGLRGFSVWFAPTTASDGSTAKPANVFLDGVSLDKTTGISPIIYGEEESRIDRFAHGIYSLNGQLISNSSSLDGLPSGIYILNGKKVIKR